MAEIHVEGRVHEAEVGASLLRTLLALGYDVPYFCWHPALGSVGACRQCAVKQFKDASDSKGRIVMSCMVPVTPGMRVSVNDPEAAAFRASMIELLMTNHPHDCPVCDEGGECHLQDMSVMTGHVYRRYRFRKRTFRNQDLGPNLNHEMNRCIQCYRCVRFYRDYAGGRDLVALASRNRVYFGRHADGALENPFSGNLVEVCPTGVFTDKKLKRHYARKWDMTYAPSVCVHCAAGCNIFPGSRAGTVRRVVNRYNHEVNGYFICDRGRFGYEFLDGEKRVLAALVARSGVGGSGRVAGSFDSVETDAAVTAVASHLARGRTIGIGSPRASLESNYELLRLVGPGSFYGGVGDVEHSLTELALDIMRKGPARVPSIREIESSDCVLVLGEPIPDTSPRMALAVRRSLLNAVRPLHRAAGIPDWHDMAVQDALAGRHGPLFIATRDSTSLDDVATMTVRGDEVKIARLGFAVAHALRPDAPPVPDLTGEEASWSGEIAAALRAASNPVVISGVSSGSAAVVQSAANVAAALSVAGRTARLHYVLPECNTLGLALLEPGLLSQAFAAARAGQVDHAIIIENDLFHRSDSAAVAEFLGACKWVTVLDHTISQTAESADVVLPAATFAESDGTFVSSEGRAQQFRHVLPAPPGAGASWKLLADAARAAPGRNSAAFETREQLLADLTRTVGLPLQAILPSQPMYWRPGWNSVQALIRQQASAAVSPEDGSVGVRLISPPTAASLPYFTPSGVSP